MSQTRMVHKMRVDILRCRVRTDQITDNIFEFEQKTWHIIDVAGHRDKRSRWAPYFETILSSVIYVFSCASYCQTMEEDPSVNRLSDSIALFQTIAEHPMIKVQAMIVFFNKYDLIEEKLSRYKISDFLSDYQSGNDKKSYVKYLESKIDPIAVENGFGIFKHKTTAIDRELMAKVIHGVQ
ncbi:guanine nucleotide binding protein, alpha subunit [Gorgonomyces haynaldii]|nr:guanine nucleotide binding protein, alpha subunit [Gorgonomyces haynaldii]